MSFSYFGGVIKKPDEALLSSVPLTEGGEETFSVPYVFEHFVWKDYLENMEQMKLNSALDAVWEALSKMDRYIQKYQPFKLIETDREKTSAVLWSLLFGLSHISWLIAPFLPETSGKIAEVLSIKNTSGEWGDFSLKDLSGSLFPKKD